MYRIGVHPRLYERLRILELLDDLAGGTLPQDLKLGHAHTQSPIVTGVWQVSPAALVCFPMLGRYQPLTMLVMTSRGAQVAILPPAGKSFIRPVQMESWPTGPMRLSMHGEGRGIYGVSVKLFEANHPDAILQSCVRGANATLEWLSDPGRWRSEDGIYESLEREIAQVSMQHAIDALMSLAADWNSSESIWTALRALGILQGIWEGPGVASVKLRDLLRPTYLEDHAVASIPEPQLREWTRGLVRNWGMEINKAFPRHSEEEALASLEDLRNLVHGAGAPKTRRADRLKTLRIVAEHRPNLQLLADVAVAWWSALLFAPESLCRPGCLPWAQ